MEGQPATKKQKRLETDPDQQPLAPNVGSLFEWIKEEDTRPQRKDVTEYYGSSVKERSRSRNYFVHTFPPEPPRDEDYTPFSEAFKSLLRQTALSGLEKIKAEYPPANARDNHVYTGSSGVALVFWKASQSESFEGDAEKRLLYLRVAESYATAALQENKNKRNRYRDVDTSFMLGEAGIFCVNAVIAYQINNLNKCKKMIGKLLYLKNYAEKEHDSEILYGKTGYLFALLFISHNLPPEVLPPLLEPICEMIFAIFAAGIATSKKWDSASPLMYIWQHRKYLGAAHGLAGILFILSHFPEYLSKEQMDLIIQSADYLLTQMQSDGNIPSSGEERQDDVDDNLVQWCHGAPGMISLFSRLYILTGKEKYLEVVLSAAEVTWKKGLLTKSLSLCHGVVGNAYFLLTAYRLTKQKTLLYRAEKFVDFSLHSPLVEWMRKPDAPYSLFEGLAGVCYAYIDMLNPDSTFFPAYEFPFSFDAITS